VTRTSIEASALKRQRLLTILIPYYTKCITQKLDKHLQTIDSPVHY